jgi:hypothetical protein
MVRLRVPVLHTFLFSIDWLLITGQAGWSCKKWYWDIYREPPRTRSFKPGSTLLIVSHRCFGEFLPFLDLINSCSLSNFYFYYFYQNKYGEEVVRHHGEGSTSERQTSTWWLCMLAEGEIAMDGESLINFILILCLCNAMIYSYIIHVVGISCLMV